MLKLAATFIDYESEHLPPDSRVVEYPFVLSRIGRLPAGKALDVGCIALHNYASPLLAFSGWDTQGLDIRDEWHFRHPNFHFIKGDIRYSDLEGDTFDLITCVSTIEHVGLVGYYGNRLQDDEGDLVAAQEITRILKPGGTLLLTVPYQREYAYRPGVRVYDDRRLCRLLGSLAVVSEMVYQQNGKGYWELARRGIEKEGVICIEASKPFTTNPLGES